MKRFRCSPSKLSRRCVSSRVPSVAVTSATLAVARAVAGNNTPAQLAAILVGTLLVAFVRFVVLQVLLIRSSAAPSNEPAPAASAALQ